MREVKVGNDKEDAALAELSGLFAPGGCVQKMNTTPAATLSAELEPPPILSTAKPYERKNEHLWQRMALELSLRAGMTPEEIAPMVGKTATAVRQILAQQKTRQYAASVCKQVASTDQRVRDYIEGKVLRAVEMLGGFLDDEKTLPKDRIMAAKELLCRRYGMPHQTIGGGSAVDLNGLPDAELARIISEGN